MARIEWIDARLWRWAEWLKVGDGSGYPVRSTLDADWSPPSPGLTPSIKVAAASDAPQTHRLVLGLKPSLRATLVAHYLMRLPPAAAGAALDCMPDTVRARIERAHRELAGALGVFATSGK